MSDLQTAPSVSNLKAENSDDLIVTLPQKIDAVICYISESATNPSEVSKQTKSLVNEVLQRTSPLSENEISALVKFVAFLLEGTSRNFRLLGFALLCSGNAIYNKPPAGTNSFATTSFFYRFMSAHAGISLWVRSFDVLACELYLGLANILNDGPEMNALLFVVDRLLSIARQDAQKTPQQRMLENAEDEDEFFANKNGKEDSNNNSNNKNNTTQKLSPRELICVPILIRLRDLAQGRAFYNSRAKQNQTSFIDEIRRTSIQLLRETTIWAPHRHLEATGIIQSLIDIYLVQETPTSFITHSDLADTITKCCVVGKLSPQDTAALFYPYVDTSVGLQDLQSEVAAANRRGRCELVLRHLASSLDGVSVFNTTAPLGLRLLIDALGLAGGSTKRKMLLMHVFVVLLHASAPHRDIQINGRWSSYASLDSAVTKQIFGSRSFIVKAADSSEGKEKGGGDDEDEEHEEFDDIGDDDDVNDSMVVIEKFETDVPTVVEAQPTTFFARDATLGALLLILEREGLSRALISVLLPTVDELDPPLAEGSIALIQLLLHLMGPLVSFEVMIAINQALDNAIAHLLKRKNPIIGALIAKALPRPTSTSIAAGGPGGPSGISAATSPQQSNVQASGSPLSGKAASPTQSGGSGNNNNGTVGAANNASSGTIIQYQGNDADAAANAAANASLNERIDQAKLLKSNQPLTEWNLDVTYAIVQSPSLMPAVVAKEKVPTRFVKHLLHFFRPDGLGDKKYFDVSFRSIPRKGIVPTLGNIGVALIDALLKHTDTTNLIDHEIPKTLADFFVGCLMDPDSKENLSQNLSGDYLRWIRVFTSHQHGLKLLAACDFFNRVRNAATTNKAPEVWEMLVKSFSGKPGVNPDPLGRVVLPGNDPRPMFYVEILKTVLLFDPDKNPSPLLAVHNKELRTAALSQLFILSARARISNQHALFAATQVVYEVMTMPTSSSQSQSVQGRSRGPVSASAAAAPQQQQPQTPPDPSIVADCDLAAQLLSMWIRLGGTDSDEWIAFENASESSIEKHIEKDYVQSVLATCFSMPESTEGDNRIGITLRKCSVKLIQYLTGSQERLQNHVFGPLRRAFEESHFFNRFEPSLPGSRRHGSLRPQVLGAIAQTETGSKLLRESPLFASLVATVNQVAKLIPSDGGVSPSALMSRLQRDASSLLSWAPAPSYSWDNTCDPAATDFHHFQLANCNITTLNDLGTGGSNNNRHQNIHVALLALGSIASTDEGAQLVGLDTLNSIVAIGSSSLSNHAPLSNFVSTAMITLSLIAQSCTARTLLSNIGTSRCEFYDPSSSSKVVANAKVAFFSPASTSEVLAQKDIVTSVFQVGKSTSVVTTTTTTCLRQQRRSGTSTPPTFSNTLMTESFASDRQKSTGSGLYYPGGSGAATAGTTPSTRKSPFTSGKYTIGGNVPHAQLQHELMIASHAETVQKEPLKAVIENLTQAGPLRSKMEISFKECPGLFADLETKRLMRLLMSQPISLSPEVRHVLAIFFFLEKSTVKKFVE